MSEGVAQQLRSKHPSRANPMPASLAPLPGMQPFARVKVRGLKDVFRKLKDDRGVGPTGRRNEYLRALAIETEDQCAQAVIPRY